MGSHKLLLMTIKR